MYDKNNFDEFLRLVARFDIHLCPDPDGHWVSVHDLLDVFELNDFKIISTKHESNEVPEIKLRCPRCGTPSTVGTDDRGYYGWCPEEKKAFSVKFI